MTSVNSIPPGWYPDPYYPQLQSLRYWDGYSWTPYAASGSTRPAPATTPDGQPLSGWWRRVGARVIDSLVLLPVQLAVAIPVLVHAVRDIRPQLDAFDRRLQRNPNEPFPDLTFSHTTIELFVVFMVTSLLLTMLYEVLFLRWKQATPGKMALGIKVRLRERPGKLPWSSIWLRYLVWQWSVPFTLIPVVGSVFVFWPIIDGLWPLGDSRRQALHEKLAKTNVVFSDR